MKSKVKYLLFAVLLGCGFMNGVSALENNDIKIYSENNTTYASFSKEYNSSKDAENDLNDFISFVEKQKGTIISIEKPKVVKLNKKTIATGKFEANDLVSIQEKAEMLKKEYKGKNTEDVIYSIELKDVVSKTVTTPTDEARESTKEFGPFDTLEKANFEKTKAENENTEYRRVECEVTQSAEIEVIARKTIDKKFSTLEEAKKYIKSLEEAGFNTSNIEIVENKTTDTKKETKKSYDKNELEAYVQSLKAEGFDGTANYSKKEEVTDQTTETINKKFDNETDAINYKNELEKTYTNTSLEVKNKSYQKTENGVVNESYLSYEEANNRLNELKENYTVTNSIIRKTVTGDGAVTYAKKYDSKSTYSLGNNNFFIIKQGAGTIAIWTMEELSSSEQASLISKYYKYNQDNNIDGSTTADKISKVKFIYGLGAFNLAELGSNWGVYTFSKDTNGQVIMTCDAKKISHAIVGHFNRIVSYKLTADYTKEITVPEYIVLGTITKDITDILYTVEIDMIKENTEYLVQGEIVKTTDKPVYNLKCNVTDIITNDDKAYEQEYSIVQNNKIYSASAKGTLNDDVALVSKTIVPKTGINGGNYEYLLFILVALMVILNIKYHTRKN